MKYWSGSQYGEYHCTICPESEDGKPLNCEIINHGNNSHTMKPGFV